MKFPSITAFEKHLKEAFPGHLAPIFLIITPCDYERRKMIEKVTGLIEKKDPQVRQVRFSGLETPLEQVRDELFTPSLWGGCTLVTYEAADKVKNTVSLFDGFPPNTYLILAGAAFKPLSELYQKGKKEIVALDLSEEKPWDKEKRLQEWLKSHNLSTEVAQYLLHHLGPDMATLDQEVQKLLCYVGQKTQVTLEDAKAICGTRDLVTGWQLAEKIVWEKPAFLGDKLSDLGFLFPFIGQLRYHLQLGYRLAEVLEKKGDIKSHFPTLRPQQIDKMIPQAKVRKAAFFHRGLEALFQLELASKSTPLDMSVLFDHFQAKLYCSRSQHVNLG